MTWVSNSYAKINLGLHVLERLPTGFHRIETGFCFLEWSDRIESRKSESYSLTLSDSDIPDGESNLITRAYRIFEKYAGLKSEYRFHVQKRIPAGAGLGGGSSNAARTLQMLNRMENAGLSNDDLVDLSRTLGSDIAFFIHGHTGIGTGLGQEIEAVDLQPDAWIVTVWPGFESSTAEAYLHCTPNPQPVLNLKTILTEEPLSEWPILLQNDLEQAVIPLHETVGNLKDQMNEFGAVYSSMSGSGSAVFGLFDQDFVALHAYDAFHDLGFRTHITRPGFRPDHGIYLKE
ncbi:MAG: 4-(cytidine 5'-diphospho)-2-C-methyl-D-erythritol kinase [Balneolaceae bacterium]